MKTKQSSAVVEPTNKVRNVVDFTNKVLYVGIDVHKKRWQVAVLLEGVILSNVSIAASADALIAYLRKHYPNSIFYCVYECGRFGFNLCRCLRSAGIECIVVNPADIPGTDREKRSKTDVLDARKLACYHAARDCCKECMYQQKNHNNNEALSAFERSCGEILSGQRTG